MLNDKAGKPCVEPVSNNVGGYSKLLATLDGFEYLETLKVSKSSTENKKGFTLAEGATHVATCYNSRKVAFTLAEVLITLAVIGVVAAITMPILVQNVQSRIKEKRIENIHQKLSKATDKMAVQSGLTGYGSTMDFVQELSKHVKLAKICDNNNLSSCWPVKEVNLKEDGKTWEISKTKNAKTLKIANPDGWDDTVGVITADGTSMILSYNKNCDFDIDTTGLKFNKETGKSNTLGCLSGVYDWNGGQNPNKLGNDIQLLGLASGLGNSCAFELGGTCYTAVFTPTPMTYAECEKEKDKLGIKACFQETWPPYNKRDDDYWAGAVKQCGHVNKFPSEAQLKAIADYLYTPDWKTAYDSGNRIQAGQILTERSASLGLPSLNQGEYFYLWSGEENSSYDAYGRYFYSDYTYWLNAGRDYSSTQAVCLGD